MVRTASLATPAPRSFSITAVIASAFLRWASRGFPARDSVLAVIHARSGAACTTPSPVTTTTAPPCTWAAAGKANTSVSNAAQRQEYVEVTRFSSRHFYFDAAGDTVGVRLRATMVAW